MHGGVHFFQSIVEMIRGKRLGSLAPRDLAKEKDKELKARDRRLRQEMRPTNTGITYFPKFKFTKMHVCNFLQTFQPYESGHVL